MPLPFVLLRECQLSFLFVLMGAAISKLAVLQAERGLCCVRFVMLCYHCPSPVHCNVGQRFAMQFIAAHQAVSPHDPHLQACSRASAP